MTGLTAAELSNATERMSLGIAQMMTQGEAELPRRKTCLARGSRDGRTMR